MNCKKPDRDVPGLKCGYPLPCPHHTVIIDPPMVEMPLYAPGNTANKLVDIAKALDKRKK